MKEVALIHLNEGEEAEIVQFLSQRVRIRRFGSGGDPARAQALIKQLDGAVAAIGLEGMPALLELGAARRVHPAGQALSVARRTPVIDGSGVRAALERWGVILADPAQPGIFSALGVAGAFLFSRRK